jgi:hypothetical protein
MKKFMPLLLLFCITLVYGCNSFKNYNEEKNLLVITAIGQKMISHEINSYPDLITVDINYPTLSIHASKFSNETAWYYSGSDGMLLDKGNLSPEHRISDAAYKRLDTIVDSLLRVYTPPKTSIKPEDDFKIIQDVENCNDDTHFQVWTYIRYNRKNIYTSRSWKPGDDKSCLLATQVSSAKKAEYKKAEKFISEYLKIK